jgi:hypothetical protein
MSKQAKSSKTTVKRTAKRRDTTQDLDSVFFLKLVLYLVLGSMWVKVTHADTLSLPLPIGLAIGLFFTSHEHFQIDRKIEYAVLLVAMFIGYFAPFGLYIAF